MANWDDRTKLLVAGLSWAAAEIPARSWCCHLQIRRIQQGSDPKFRRDPCRTAVDHSALQCACARAEEPLSDLVSPTNPILYISYERKEGFDEVYT